MARSAPRPRLSPPLRAMLRERRRLVLSMVAVALGVGYLAGSLSLLDRVGEGLARQSGVGTEPADLVIEGTVSLESPLEYVRRLVPAALVDTVRAVPGVAGAAVRVESPTVIIPASSEPVVSLGLTERPLGANWVDDPALTPYRIQSPGRPPAGDDQVVIDARTAAAGDIAVGDQVQVAAKTTSATFTVTGILEDADVDPAARNQNLDSSTALFDLPTAQRLFDLTTDATAIAIRLEPGVDPAQVRSRIEAVLPFGTELATGELYAEHRLVARSKGFALVRILLGGFAVLAVVVAAFTVANSMLLLFEQRRRRFALFRLVGASVGQLRQASAVEATIAGAVAGLVGAVAGLGIGWLIEEALRTLDTTVPTAGPIISWWVPPLALGAGMVVTVLVSLGPARAAARTPPVEAVNSGWATRQDPRRWARRGAGVLLVSAGAGAIGALSGGLLGAAVTAGACLLVLVAGSVTALLIGRVVILLAGLLAGSPGLRRIVNARSDQARRRTVATAGALAVAVAVLAGLAVLASSFATSLDTSLTKAVRADLVVDSGTLTVGGLPADLIPTLRRVEGVAAVTGWRIGSATVGSATLRVGGVDGASAFRLLDLDVVGRTPDALPQDGIAISEPVAESLGVRTGSSVVVGFATSGRPMRVVAVYRTPLRLLLGDALVDTSVLQDELGQSVDAFAFVDLEQGATAAVRDAVTATALAGGAKQVIEPTQLVDSRVDVITGFGRVIQWMLLFTIVLALIGVANTLQLGVWERRRELGLLRAVGATREQVVRIVTAEASALGIVGVVSGLLVGLAVARVAVAALGSYGLTEFSAPPATLAVIALIALALGILGALLPARQAAATPILDAIDERDTPTRSSPTAGSGSSPGSDLSTVPRPEVDPPSAAPHDGQSPQADMSRIVSGVPMSAVPHHEPAPPMSEPCFQCGEDPGAEQRCVHCGAPRVVPAAALFSTGGEPDIPAPPPAPPPPPPPRVETPPPLPRPSFQPDPGPRPTGAGLFTAGTSEEANGQTEWAEPSFGIGDAGEAPVFGIEDPLVDDDIADAEIIEDDGDMAIVADAPPEPVPAMFSAAAPPAADGYPAPGAPSEESETAEESAPAEPAVDSAGDGEAGLAVDAEPQVELDGDAAPDEARVSDDVAAATLGAIFAAPPDRTDDNPAARSPFGQFANDPDPTTVGRWSTVDPEVEPIDAAAERARRRRAAAAERAEPVDTPSYVTPPTIAPPPAYRSATPTPPVPAAPAAISSPAASAPFAEWQVEAAAAGSPTTPEPDDHGLAGAVHRLSSNALQQATVALSVAGALLDENESVVGAVTGSSLGLPAAVVVTTDRVLVVIDRRWVPQVERFSLTPSLHVHGRHHQGAATLTFSDRERLITVDHIVDVAVAIEVANTVRSLAAGSEF